MSTSSTLVMRAEARRAAKGLPQRLLLTAWGGWADALFELTDAVLCAAGPVCSVPALSLGPTFRRSHGSIYKALSKGEVDQDQLRELLVRSRPTGWPLIFAVDASTWERSDAETSPERGFYHSASKHLAGQPIVAGWSFQWVSQLNFVLDSWTGTGRRHACTAQRRRHDRHCRPGAASDQDAGRRRRGGDVRLRRRLRPCRHLLGAER